VDEGIILKLILKIGLEGEDRNQVVGPCEYVNKPSSCKKGGGFVKCLNGLH
jgi:hypothetical protein